MRMLKKIISHRGNLTGRNPARENSPLFIMEALDMGFDVEIDFWVVDGKCWLGHDEPQHLVEIDFLIERKQKLWVHAKNIEAVSFLRYEDLNWFWHENDKLVLTSKGYPWCNFNIFVKGGITVQFDFKDIPDYVYGICTDEVLKYQQ